jgi:hypothetical protein
MRARVGHRRSEFIAVPDGPTEFSRAARQHKHSPEAGLFGQHKLAAFGRPIGVVGGSHPAAKLAS